MLRLSARPQGALAESGALAAVCGRGRVGGWQACSGGAHRPWSITHPTCALLADLVEKRVLIFRLLRSALCEALAQVQAAGALLYLQQQQPPGPAATALAAAAAPAPAPGGGVGHAASAAEIAAAGAEEEGLFQRADRLVTASLAGVTTAFAQLDASVHSTLDAQQGPAAPPAADQQVLQGALSRVLGLSHLRRVFSRLQLGGRDQAAAADAAAAAPPPPLPAAPVALAARGAPLTAAQALGEARRAVGFAQLLPGNASVHSALEAARRAGCSPHSRRLIEVPRWARMPSELQQHWILYGGRPRRGLL